MNVKKEQKINVETAQYYTWSNGAFSGVYMVTRNSLHKGDEHLTAGQGTIKGRKNVLT